MKAHQFHRNRDRRFLPWTLWNVLWDVQKSSSPCVRCSEVIKSNVDIRMAVSNYRSNACTLIHDAVRRRKARRHDSHVSLFVLSTMSWTDVDRPLSRRRRKAHPSWTHEWITKERRHMFRIWRYQNAFRNEGVIKLYCCRHGRLWKANRQS